MSLHPPKGNCKAKRPQTITIMKDLESNYEDTETAWISPVSRQILKAVFTYFMCADI